MAKKSRGSAVNLHAHGCTSCGRRYEDVCWRIKVGPKGGETAVAGDDGLCFQCRTGHEAVSIVGRAPERWPKDCCRANARSVREHEAVQYQLAGSGPWFICTVCHRTFPFANPAQEQDQRQGEHA